MLVVSSAPHLSAPPARLVLFREPPRGRVRAQASQSYDVVVVGAGVCGLCTAHALASKHRDSVPNLLVTEARDRVGGNITTVSSDEGYLWEEGPNSFTPNDAIFEIAVRALQKDYHLGNGLDPAVLVPGSLRL